MAKNRFKVSKILLAVMLIMSLMPTLALADTRIVTEQNYTFVTDEYDYGSNYKSLEFVPEEDGTYCFRVTSEETNVETVLGLYDSEWGSLASGYGYGYDASEPVEIELVYYNLKKNETYRLSIDFYTDTQAQKQCQFNIIVNSIETGLKEYSFDGLVEYIDTEYENKVCISSNQNDATYMFPIPVAFDLNEGDELRLTISEDNEIVNVDKITTGDGLLYDGCEITTQHNPLNQIIYDYYTPDKSGIYSFTITGDTDLYLLFYNNDSSTEINTDFIYDAENEAQKNTFFCYLEKDCEYYAEWGVQDGDSGESIVSLDYISNEEEYEISGYVSGINNSRNTVDIQTEQALYTLECVDSLDLYLGNEGDFTITKEIITSYRAGGTGELPGDGEDDPIVDGSDINCGENTVIVPQDEALQLTFIPPTDGTYVFTTSSDNEDHYIEISDEDNSHKVRAEATTDMVYYNMKAGESYSYNINSYYADSDYEVNINVKKTKSGSSEYELIGYCEPLADSSNNWFIVYDDASSSDYYFSVDNNVLEEYYGYYVAVSVDEENKITEVSILPDYYEYEIGFLKYIDDYWSYTCTILPNDSQDYTLASRITLNSEKRLHDYEAYEQLAGYKGVILYKTYVSGEIREIVTEIDYLQEFEGKYNAATNSFEGLEYPITEDTVMFNTANHSVIEKDDDILADGACYPVKVIAEERDGSARAIAVEVRNLDDFYITKAKTEYIEGETFDLSDWQIIACYDDGEEKDVTSLVSISGIDLNQPLEAGNKTIIISYTDYGTTIEESYNITVKKALPDITISGLLKVGATLQTDLDVTASYQWYRSADGLSWTPISDEIGWYYTIKDADIGCYLKVVATGEGEYGGTVSCVTTRKIKGENIKFDKGTGSAIVKADKAYTDAVVYFAAYKNGKLTALKPITMNLSAGDNTIIPQDFDYSDATTLKIMVWETAKEINPLFEACTVILN